MALFAGYDTTSVTLARMLQLLASAEGKGLVDRLLAELKTNYIVDEEGKLNDDVGKTIGKGASGIFEAFPLLESIVLENSRYVCRVQHTAANY